MFCLLVVGSGKSGPNSSGGTDVDCTPFSSSNNTTNVVNSSNEIQKNLFGSPQLHPCTTNDDAERNSLKAHEVDNVQD